MVLRVLDLGRLLRPATLRLRQPTFPSFRTTGTIKTYQLTATFLTSEIGSLSSLSTSAHSAVSMASSWMKAAS